MPHISGGGGTGFVRGRPGPDVFANIFFIPYIFIFIYFSNPICV
jgi:hypothetical protein